MRGDSSRHDREGSPYARDKFTIDFDRQQVTCPQGHRSATWNPGRQDGQDVIVVSFPSAPATAVTGIRQARYIGLDKVSLEHAFASAAVNLIRLYAWWTGTPVQRTRTTHLSRLDLASAA